MAHAARQRVTGVLLAGGKSLRMGTDKALLDFLGAPMAAWCAAALAQCASTLIVASSSEAHAARSARAVEGAWPRFTVLRGLSVEAVVDAPGPSGPLAGFVAALERARSPHVVVSACDTPLVPARFYREALALLAQHDAAAPRLDAPEALISAWRREPALREAREALVAGKGPRAVLERLNTRYLDATALQAWSLEPACFASANTPEALDRLRAKGARSTPP